MPIEFQAALISVAAISLIALVGLAGFAIKQTKLNRVLYYLIALSVGALFGDTAIHLLPEIYNSGFSPVLAGTSFLIGIFVFFGLEKYFHWLHRHSTEEDAELRHSHIEPVGYLSLISDAIHNFIDGLIIGASYLVSIEVGIATTIAIALHELPHEIGDYGLLLYAGFTRTKALLFNFVSALSAVLGTVIVLIFGSSALIVNGIILPIAAGGFIYIAGSDLVPELHKTTEAKKSLIQFLFIAAGIGIMYLLLLFD